MKRLIGTFALLLAIGISAIAQMQRMSPDDQDRFNSYYSRWLQYKQTNDRDDMISMEQRGASLAVLCAECLRLGS